MFFTLLVACTSVTPIQLGDSKPLMRDTDTTIDDVPPLEDTNSTTIPTSPLTAPARILLDCPGAIPLTGKTDCQIQIQWPDESPVFAGPAGVGVHGRSSSSFPKLQYAIELRDDAGADAPVDLFGMGEDADWLLNGMYIDRALFRNKLAYDLFRDMGHAAAESAYTELWLNGAYWGVYLLTERIERGKIRVDMPADDGQGTSFIVKASESGIASTLQYGSWEILYPHPADPVVTRGIRAQLSQMESRINTQDAALWTQLQQESFLDFVLIEEFLKNNDGYFLSHHLYTDAAQQINFIPWDLDLTLGQPYYNDNWRTDTWVLYRPDLIAKPFLDPAVHRALQDRWATLRSTILATDAVLARTTAYHDFLGDAIDRNFERWDITQIQFSGNQLYPVSSAAEEYQLVQDWIVARLAWMDTAIQDY